MSDDEIADVYEDYLDKESDVDLVGQLLMLVKLQNKPVIKLCEYERTQLQRMIRSFDYTGEKDLGFEDERKRIVG